MGIEDQSVQAYKSIGNPPMQPNTNPYGGLGSLTSNSVSSYPFYAAPNIPNPLSSSISPNLPVPSQAGIASYKRGGGIAAHAPKSAPLSSVAQGLAKYGRNGDTVLVHMTRGELQGLKSLAQQKGTSLTINPHTGLPELWSLKSIGKAISKGVSDVGHWAGHAVAGAAEFVTSTLVDVVDIIKDPSDTEAWTDLRDDLEVGAVAAGNIYVPGSSVLTSHLVSDSAEDTLNNTPFGQALQVATSIAGAGGGGAGATEAGATEAGADVAGAGAADVAGAEVAGAGAADVAGAEVAGAEVAGADVAGAEVAGEILPPVVDFVPPEVEIVAPELEVAGPSTLDIVKDVGTGLKVANTGLKIYNIGKSAGLWGGSDSGSAGSNPLAVSGTSGLPSWYTQGVPRKTYELKRVKNPNWGKPGEPYYLSQEYVDTTPTTSDTSTTTSDTSTATPGATTASSQTNADFDAAYQDYKNSIAQQNAAPHGDSYVEQTPMSADEFKKGWLQTHGGSTTATSMAGGGLAGINRYFAGGGVPSYAMGGGLDGYAAGGKLLDGPGDGMSDSIPAEIRGKRIQKALLADGEFVIPADVVSHLGNGSTKAGSKVLYKMMDRVRQARTGTTQQGRQIDPNKFIPA